MKWLEIFLLWVQGVALGIAFYLGLLVLMNWLERTFKLKPKRKN